MVSQVSTRRHL